jgi:hypothetical protein
LMRVADERKYRRHLLKAPDRVDPGESLNRELASVHYPSDSAAGKRLADLFVAEATSYRTFQSL